MPGKTRPGVAAPTRRDFFKRGAGLAATGICASAFSGCRPFAPFNRPTVPVGILHSQTGNLLIMESSLRDAELLAIEEINANGGVLGFQLMPVVEDGRSRSEDVFPKLARKLLAQDRVAAVFGCYITASRKAVLPIFEELNGLLFYPVQCEGFECSRNVIYTGAIPNQQVLPAIDWLQEQNGDEKLRLFLIGPDSPYGRTMNYIVEEYLKVKEMEVLGVQHVDLNQEDFGEHVARIKDLAPDAVINTIGGLANLAFFRELERQAITSEQFVVLSTAIGEDELRTMTPAQAEGHLSAWGYFQSINTAENQAFIQRFQQAYGYDCVTDDPIQTAYSQVYLWKAAVERAGSFEVDDVRNALTHEIAFEAPAGTIKIDPKTHYAYRRFRLGKVRENLQFDIIYESPELIAPEPFPQFAFPGWGCDFSKRGLTRGKSVELESPE